MLHALYHRNRKCERTTLFNNVYYAHVYVLLLSRAKFYLGAAGARARAGLSTFESSAIHQGTKYAHQKKRTVLEFAERYKIAH